MTPPTPRSARFPSLTDDDLPDIDTTDAFQDVVRKFQEYIVKSIDAAYSYEQLRTTIAGHCLRPLVLKLSEDCHHPALVAALLAARYNFDSKNEDDPRLAESRALACELVAWQFLTYLSEKELIDHLLYELPAVRSGLGGNARSRSVDTASPIARNEHTPLLGDNGHETHSTSLRPPKRNTKLPNLSSTSLALRDETGDVDELAESMAGMNALEIAAVANAKKFLSQRQVQHIIEDIWNGDIIFWDSLSTRASKSPKIYNEHTADPFSRLRVPKYQKAFQVAFFMAFLILYYAVLVQRNTDSVSVTEVFLYIWIAAFAYDEFSELRDAGFLFYQTDFWSAWDIAIILVGMAFFVIRVVGLVKHSDRITNIAFDVLSMAALFLVPRICSVASLNPYFGSLLPVLKEMTTAFCKFLPVIVVLYLGFLTTFTMLARDRLTLNEVSWLLVKVFFGSSYLGFDFAVQISPLFGTTLMVIFVALTNILLLTALISLVSNSLEEVMAHARETYTMTFSIFVLESCTSQRLTYFIPPTNLIPLLLVRPLRLFLPSDRVRQIRVLLLRAVSLPFVALIWFYEGSRRLWYGQGTTATRIHSRPLSTRSPSHRLSYYGGERSASALKRPDPSSTHSVNGNTSMSASTMAVDSDLLNMIQRLSAQVEELTAMVAAQKAD